MRRLLSLSATTLIASVLIVAIGPPAAADPGKCDVAFIDPVCEVGKSLAGKAGDIATAPVRYAAGGAVDAMTSWVADTAKWILRRVVSFINASTTPTLDAGWFVERYRFMIGLGALVLLPMLLVATIRAVVSQDMSQLLRSFFVHLPVAVLGTFVAIHVTQALLSITDVMSAAVARNVAGDVSQIFESVNGALSEPAGVGPAAPSFAIFFAALLLVLGAFFVWLELLIRSAAVTAAVFFLPMVLAGLVWPATMRWTKRLIEIIVALILSKFVIVAVISLATAALGDPGGGGFGTVMGASALMLMAAFSPFALLKLVPMVEGAAIDHLQGKASAPVNAFRAGGGVNQIVSVMRAKTTQGSTRGLAVAGAVPRSGVAAGGATAGAVMAGQAAKSAAAKPGQKVEKHVEPDRSTGESQHSRKRSRAGGAIAPSPSNGKRDPRDRARS